MSSAPTLAQKVSNIKHMPVLLAATSATKDPADGYLVKDIIKMSFESYQTRLFLLQYLVNQLITNNNVYSKIKILRLFLVLLEEGHIEFKQTLRRTPEPFNEAAKLRPLQGKDQKMVSECGRIRDMASKVLDVLYTDVPEMRRSNPYSVESSSSETGFGSSSSNSSNGASRITGFGNTGPAKPSTTEKLKSLFGTTGKSNAVVYDPSYATMDPVPHNSSANTPFTVHVPNTGNPHRYQGSEGRPAGVPHERGHAGGGWSNGKDHTPPSQQRSQSGRFKPTTTSYDGDEDVEEHLSSTGEDLSSYEQNSIEQEQRLVDDITAPGGVRAAPPRESLNKFVARCKVLDSLSVVDCLRQKLSSSESQTVLRALFVIETLLRSDVPDILSHLDIVLEDLNSLSSSQNSSIQAKAKKISVQLSAVNAQREADQALTGQQLTAKQVEEEEEGEEEEEVDGTETTGVSSIFSGLSVSGETGTRLSKKTRKHTPRTTPPGTTPPGTRATAKHTSRTTPPGTRATAKHTRATAARKAEARVQKEEKKDECEDILGLGDLTMTSQTTEPAQQEPQEEAGLPQALVGHDEEPAIEEDNSLLTFEEEEVEFDPLVRTDSMNRSNSFGLGLGGSGTLSNAAISKASAGLERSLEPAPAIPADSGSKPPLVSKESLGHIQDLTGVDLTMSTSAPAGHAPQLQQRQDSYSELLYPLQGSSAANVMPGTMGMVTAVPGGGMMPHPHAGMVPHPHGGMQLGGPGYGGVPYVGGAPAVAYAPAPQGMMYHQPQFGGVARPVQRAAAAKEDTPPPDAGFSFLGKSNKSTAFDFVQDEMKATRTKK